MPDATSEEQEDCPAKPATDGEFLRRVYAENIPSDAILDEIVKERVADAPATRE